MEKTRCVSHLSAHHSLIRGSWVPLTTFTQSDTGNERTVIDTDATGTKKFYRVMLESH